MNRLWPIFRYDHPALIRVIWEKSERFRRAPDKPTPVLQAAVADARTVLDFGGAFGTDYWRLASPAIRWAVVEQPRFVAAAQPLASDRLRFFTSCAEAARWLGSVDVLWSASVLFYVPDLAQTIRDWLEVAPEQIVLTRMQWSDRVTRTLQWSRLSENGPGPLPPGERDGRVCYRRTAVPRAWVVERLTGYQIVRDLPDGFVAARTTGHLTP